MKILNSGPTVQPGMYVMYAGKTYLYVGDSENGRAQLHRLGAIAPIEVPSDQLSVIHGDKFPVTKLQELEKYPEEHVEVAKKRLEAIQPLLEAAPTKESLEKAAQKLGVSLKTVQRIFDRYLFSGQRLSSLIPRVMYFGSQNRKLTEDQRRILGEVIRDKYLKEEKPSFESIANAVRLACRNAKVDEVGRTTVFRELRRLSPSMVVMERLGKKAAREMFHAHRGKAPIGDRPLALVEIDHSQLDVFVILPSGKVYRPWITVAIDTYSRMVLGFYLTMDAPSQLSVGLCLYRAMSPKTEWLRQHGITTSWPCYGRWISAITDNAKEFRGYYLMEVGLEHDISIFFRAIGNPNWGAHIERLMGNVAAQMHLLPGTSFSNPVEKGEYDPKTHAIFTLEQIEEVLLHYIVEVYHCSPHSGLGNRTPLSRWVAYYAQASDEQGPHLPQIQAGNDLLISLLPNFKRTIQQDGVEWEALRYYDSVLSPFVRTPNPARADKLWRFHFDPRDVRCIFWVNPSTGQPVSIPLRDTTAPGMTLWDLADFRAKDRAEAAATHDQETVDHGLNAIDGIVQASQPLQLKDHRKRKKAVKDAAQVIPPSTSVLTLNAPPIELTTPFGSSPVEDPDPLMWDDLRPFEVDPLFDPNSTQNIGETRVP